MKCSICKKESCDGRKWLLEFREPYLGQFCSHIICANDLCFKSYSKNDKRYVRIKSDEGYEEDIEIIAM